MCGSSQGIALYSDVLKRGAGFVINRSGLKVRMRHTRREKAQLLIMALSILFILVLLASALIYSSQFTTRLTLRAMRENWEEQCVENAEVKVWKDLQNSKIVGKPYPTPTPSPFVVTPTFMKAFKMEGVAINYHIQKGAGFRTDDIPSVGFEKDYTTFFGGAKKLPPWFCFVQVRNTKDAPPSLKNQAYTFAFSGAFPYAVYAPNGKITLNGVYGYANPTMKEMAKHNENSNYEKAPIPVELMAKGDIWVTDFPYGFAFTSDGSVNIDNLNGGIGLKRSIQKDSNGKTYAENIETDIINAYYIIADKTLNKSAFLYGAPINISTFFKILIGKEKPSVLEHVFSIEQAMKFPFFMWIGFKVVPIGIGEAWEIYFHVPLPPDGRSPDDKDQKKIKRDMKFIKSINDTWKGVNTKGSGDYVNEKFYKAQMGVAAKLKSRIEAGETVDKKEKKAAKDLIKSINSYFKTKTVKKGKKEVTYHYIKYSDLRKLKKKEQKYALIIQKYWDEKRKHGDHGITWTVEKFNKLSKDGEIEVIGGNWSEYEDEKEPWGYNYSVMIKKSAKFLWDLITKGPYDAMKGMIYSLRMIHFYDGEHFVEPDYKVVDGNYGLRKVIFASDWTVPKNRSLRLDCNLVIKGDLWLQDGATLYVKGDLIILKPDEDDESERNKVSDEEDNFREDLMGGTKKVLKHRGRVFLGRGANLLVGGNFSCEGDPEMGSVLVESELGDVKFITSSILCKGDVTIPYGVFPGLSLYTIGKGMEAQGESLAGKYFQELGFVPSQVAKLIGPFHLRYCCFAEYPDPWTILYMEILEIPIIIPFPDPLDISVTNINISIFRILSTAYHFILNGTLGENLFTDSSWWTFGYGSVLMFPKVMGTQDVVDYFTQFSDYEIFADDILDTLATLLAKIAFKEILDKLVMEMLPEIITKVIAEFTDIPESIINRIVRELFSCTIAKLLDEIKEKLPHLYFHSLISHMDGYFQNVLAYNMSYNFYETSGALIYAGGNLKIGDAYQSCPYAAGFFIAHKNLESYADKTVGCLVSVTGDITAKDFYYYPYFSRASLNVPADFSGAGDIFKEILDPTVNGISDQYLSDHQPIEIGKRVYHITAEGWSHQ